MNQRRRVEYVPETPLGRALDALAVYQRQVGAGELAAAAAAARTAELAVQRLTDAALTDASAQPGSSSRQVAAEVGMPPATVTYRIRRYRNRENEES